MTCPLVTRLQVRFELRPAGFRPECVAGWWAWLLREVKGGVLGPDRGKAAEETLLPASMLGLPGAGLALRASGDRPPGWEAFSAGAGWLGQLLIPSLCLSFHLPSSTLPDPGCHGTSLIRQADPWAPVEVLGGLGLWELERRPPVPGESKCPREMP